VSIESGGGTQGKRNVEKCLNCQFFDRRNARPTDGRAAMWGQCRRHSPHLNPLSVKSYLVEGVWPLIRDDDWCGEWRATTQASMSRSQFTPRTDELSTTAMAATSAAADRSVSAGSAVAAVAGDD
jgi:hypothetical protein